MIIADIKKVLDTLIQEYLECGHCTGSGYLLLTYNRGDAHMDLVNFDTGELLAEVELS